MSEQSQTQSKPNKEFSQHVWFYQWFARGEAFRAVDRFPIHKKEALVTIDYLADPMVPRMQGYAQASTIPHETFGETIPLYQAIMEVVKTRGSDIKGMKPNPNPKRLDLLLTEGPEDRYLLWVREVPK